LVIAGRPNAVRRSPFIVLRRPFVATTAPLTDPPLEKRRAGANVRADCQPSEED